MLTAAVNAPRVTSAMSLGWKVKPLSPRKAESSPNGSVAMALAPRPKAPRRKKLALKPTRASSGAAFGGATLVNGPAA